MTSSPATTSAAPDSAGPTPETVLAEIRNILITVLGEYALDDVEISGEMSLTDDLGLESIDLVTIGSLLARRYGDRLNLAAFLAEMDIDEVIGLKVGVLVDFVVDWLTADHGQER